MKMKYLLIALSILVCSAARGLEPYDLTQETRTITELASFSTEGGKANGTSVIDVFEGYAYGIFQDSSRRPRVFKVNLTNSTDISVVYMDTKMDYLKRDGTTGPYQMSEDGHHTVGIVVDGDGYIHLVLDMHNYPSNPANFWHLPVDWNGSTILYWTSTAPYDISNFEFLGNSGTQAPQGFAWTYQRLLRDRMGNVYISARNVLALDQSVEACKGAGLSKYSLETKTWERIGGDTGSSLHPNHGVGWEDNGEAGGQYTKEIPDFAFDSNNKMHMTFNLLNTSYDFQALATANGMGNIYHWFTHSMYVGSPDIGINGNNAQFEKANQAAVVLPIRAEAGAFSSQGDIVYEAPGYDDLSGPDFEDYIVGTHSRVTFDINNNPLVISSKKQLHPDVTPPRQMFHYENGQWNAYTTMGLSGEWDVNDSSDAATDNHGVMMLMRGNDWYRMFHPQGTVVRHVLPNVPGSIARAHFTESGDMIALRSDSGVFRVEKYEWTYDTTVSFTNDPIVAPNVRKDEAYNSSIADSATDTNGDPLTYAKLNGPTWLNIATNGALSGTPTVDDLGDNRFLIQASAIGGTAITTLDIRVYTLDPPDVPSEIALDSTSESIVANGSIAGKTITLTEGARVFSIGDTVRLTCDLGIVGTPTYAASANWNVGFIDGNAHGANMGVRLNANALWSASVDSSAGGPGANTPDLSSGYRETAPSVDGTTADLKQDGDRASFELNVTKTSATNYTFLAYWKDSSGTILETFSKSHTKGVEIESINTISFGNRETTGSVTGNLTNVTLEINPDDGGGETDPWIAWLALYPGLETSTNYTDDAEPGGGDGLNNLLEYALGGNPLEDDAVTFMPKESMDGTYLNYVYRRSITDIGVTYSVVSGTDLVNNNITNATEQAGNSGDLGEGYESVTNRVPTASETKQFMQLKVQKD